MLNFILSQTRKLNLNSPPSVTSFIPQKPNSISPKCNKILESSHINNNNNINNINNTLSLFRSFHLSIVPLAGRMQKVSLRRRHRRWSEHHKRKNNRAIQQNSIRDCPSCGAPIRVHTICARCALSEPLAVDPWFQKKKERVETAKILQEGRKKISQFFYRQHWNEDTRLQNWKKYPVSAPKTSTIQKKDL